MTGKLIIITGFSGAGKDTLMNMLLDARPQFERIITHTSRPPRAEEKEGKDYYFVSAKKFETMLAKGELLEHVIYGSVYKGTSLAEFKKVLSGKNLVWRIDMSRAAIVEETFLEKFDGATAQTLITCTKKIMIKTPSVKSSLKRFRDREGAGADVAEFYKRLQKDLSVWKEHRHKFPHIINNRTGKIKEALTEILRIIEE